MSLSCSDNKTRSRPTDWNRTSNVTNACIEDGKRIKVDAEKRRFRINNSSLPVYKWRTIYWCRHRNYVENIKAEVDSSNPRFPPAIFVGNNIKYRRRLANFIRIDTENALLAQKIKKKVTDKSQVGNELNPLTKCINNRGKTRLMLQNEVVLENMGIARRLCEVRPVYSRKKQLKWYDEQEYFMERAARYPLYWKSKICQSLERQAMNNANSNSKPMVYFDFQVKNAMQGRVIVELNPKAAPILVENFLSLCKGQGKRPFKCCRLDKMWPGTYWTGGKGAQGLKGSPFPVNKFSMKHDRRGIFSLINNGNNMFDAEFMITARELVPLNGRNLAIGTVVHGMAYLESLDKYRSKNSMAFQTPVLIIKTGELDANGPFPSSYLSGYSDEEGAESEYETETADDNESKKVGKVESGEFEYDAKKDQS